MTIDEFNNTVFKKDMFVLYKGCLYKLSAVDFDKKEVMFYNDNDNPIWTNCENIKIV